MPVDIEVRDVQTSDAAALTHLLRGVRFDRSIDDVCQQMAATLNRRYNPAIVASEDGQVVGIVALHFAPMLFVPEPIARVTILYVDEIERRRGIGRLLIEVAAARAFQGGCDTIELMADLDREDCRAFFSVTDFKRTSSHLTRRLLPHQA